MKNVLQTIAAQHGVRVVSKVPRGIEIDDPDESSEKGKKTPKKPKVNPKLKALLTLDPQILLMKVLAKSKMNVTETTLERIFDSEDVSTVFNGLEYVKASELRDAVSSILDTTVPDWKKRGFVVYIEKAVFFVEGDIEKMHEAIAMHALMLENRKEEEEAEEEKK